MKLRIKSFYDGWRVYCGDKVASHVDGYTFLYQDYDTRKKMVKDTEVTFFVWLVR